MKICTKCNQNKDFSLFGKKQSSVDGFQYWCKVCTSLYKKQYYISNLEKARKERISWKIKNKEKVLSYERSFQSKRYQSDIIFRIKKNQRNRIKQLLTNKPTSFTNSLGCGSTFLKIYLESLFQPGMTWENYGSGVGRWNVDHIRPLSSFDDLMNPQQFKAAFNYKNLQPLWWQDNLLKSNKWSKNESK